MQTDADKKAVWDSYQLDSSGRLTGFESSNGHIEEWLLDASGLKDLVTTTFANADIGRKTLDYSYDSNGRRDTLTDELGVEDIERDQLGRVNTITHRDGTMTTLVWDEASRLVTRKLANGTQDRIIYDDAGEIAGHAHIFRVPSFVTRE